MLGGLIFLKVFGAQLVKFINAGWGFIRSAAGASSPSQLINPSDPAAFYLLTFYFFVLVGLGLGSLKSLRLQGRFSFSGMFVGLINGYIVAAYTVDVLFPAYAFLPVPIQVPGMTPQIPPPGMSIARWPRCVDAAHAGLEQSGEQPGSAVDHRAVAIFVFLILASRLSGKKG